MNEFEEFLKKSGLFKEHHLMHEKYFTVWMAGRDSMGPVVFGVFCIGVTAGVVCVLIISLF
jgi:hypothetical protein